MRWKNIRYFVEPYVCRRSIGVKWDIKVMQQRKSFWSGQILYRVRDVLYGEEIAVVESFAKHNKIRFSQLEEAHQRMLYVAQIWREAKSPQVADMITPMMGFPVSKDSPNA